MFDITIFLSGSKLGGLPGKANGLATAASLASHIVAEDISVYAGVVKSSNKGSS